MVKKKAVKAAASPSDDAVAAPDVDSTTASLVTVFIGPFTVLIWHFFSPLQGLGLFKTRHRMKLTARFP